MGESGAGRSLPEISWWERALLYLVRALGRSPLGPTGAGKPRGVLHIFRLVERIDEHRYPLRLLRPDGFVRYQLGQLPRGSIALPDGSTVRQGDPVVIIHFDNRVLVDLATRSESKQALPWQLYRIAREDFAALAELARSGALPPQIRVVWSETILYPPLARLGFRTEPSPRTFRTPFARVFMLGLLAIYAIDGLAYLESERQEHFRLGVAWMELDEMIRRFLPAERRGTLDHAGG